MKSSKKLIGIGLVGLVSLAGCNRHTNNSINNILANKPPIAKAIFSYSVPFNQINSIYPKDGVILEGACSYDPDGKRIEYVWSMDKIPAGSKLTDNDILNRFKANPVFYPDITGDYKLKLKVTDEKGESNEDYITINVKDNKFPRLKIYPSQTLTGLEGEVIKFKAYDTVDRKRIYEITDSNVLNYRFNKTGGEFSWATNCSDSGIYALNIKAKYAYGSGSLTYRVSLFVEENPNCVNKKIGRPRVETKKEKPKILDPIKRLFKKR